MSTTVGKRLRQARESRSLSIDQAVTATRIRHHYLQAMEAGDFGDLPSAAQARGFLRAYAGFLALDPEPLLALLDGRDIPTQPASTSDVRTQRASLGQSAASDQIPSLTSPEQPPDPAPGTQQSALDQPPTSASTSPTAGPSAAKSSAYSRPVSAPLVSAASSAITEEALTDPAQEIFVGIGVQLRQQRERLGLSIEDVERHTHLRLHYLQALENGDMDGLPSPVQGRGMLNNYAAFLGLDPESLLLRFADGLQARLAARQVGRVPERRQPRRSTTSLSWLPPPLRRIFGRIFVGDFLIGGALAAFLAIFVLWGATRIFTLSTDQSASVSATAPSIADVLLATPTPTITPSPAPVDTLPPSTAFVGASQPPTAVLPPQFPPGSTPGIDTPAATPGANAQLPTLAASGGVQVNLGIRQRAWLRVLVDGEVEFEGRVLPGSAYPFAGNEQIEVLTSNGAGVQVTFEGVDLGLMGALGQVVNRIYTRQGILTPTATVTPTSAATQSPTASPPVPLAPGQGPAPALP